jgi:hypothetical protein
MRRAVPETAGAMKVLAKSGKLPNEGNESMRRPGREFGSEDPRLIYVALRWNDPSPKPDQESRMIKLVAGKLECKQ